MGEGKRRKEKFFSDHPRCCFCGGVNAAEEIDHQPSRDFFIQRSSPAELRFPSCSRCNRNSSFCEAVFNFYSRFDTTGIYSSDKKQLGQRIHDIHKRYPTLKPFLISGKEKRQAFRKQSWKKPGGLLWQEAPVIAFNPNVLEIVDLVIAKIGVAFFYKYFGYPAPVNSEILVTTESNISVTKPKQIELFDLKFKDFQLLKNPNPQAEGQLLIKLAYNKKQKLFGVHLRVNRAYFSTVGILFEGNTFDNDEVITLTENGFPWSKNLAAILHGEPTYEYYSENRN